MKRLIPLSFSICGLLLLRSGLIMAAQADQPIPQVSEPPYVPGDNVKAPVPLYQPLPSYTAAARSAQIEGIVFIQAIIRKDGTVSDCRVLRGLGYGLDESAVQTITEKWRFKPGSKDGVPVDVMANIEVSFRFYAKPTEAEQEILKKYPVRVQIVEAKWIAKLLVGADGSGYGNLLSGNSMRGFKYTCSCDDTFRAGTTYHAKWKKDDSRLEIMIEYGGGSAIRPCELQVRLTDSIYLLKDGMVVASSGSAK